MRWFLYKHIDTELGIKAIDRDDFIFPFSEINHGEKIVLYGAGEVGKEYLRQIKTTKYCKVSAWVSKDFATNEFSIILESPLELNQIEFDKIVIAVLNEKVAEQIRSDIKEIIPDIEDEKIVWCSPRIENIETFKCHHPQLEKFKDIHKGKRIFVIGNEPSLNIKDLETLKEHGEICIGCNKLYRAYDKTNFRADYIAFSDWRIIEDCINDIPNISENIIMLDSFEQNEELSNCKNINYCTMIKKNFFYNCPIDYIPTVSSDITVGFINNGTVVNDIGIQLAAYMGAKEIILLGVDFNYTDNYTDNANHFIDNYFNENEKNSHNYNFQYEELSMREKIDRFEQARKYYDVRGIKIYNATRGGKLEVFERVDFDKLFE